MTDTVVIGLNWVGDNILALPTYRALHHRFRHEGGITIAVPQNIAPLLGAAGVCRSVIALEPGMRRRIRAIREGGFRRAVVLPNSFRAAAVAFAAGISERWGYSTDMRGVLLTHGIKRTFERGHQLDDYAALLSALNAPRVVDELPALSIPVELRDRAERRLRSRGITFERPLIGIHAGGLYGSAKHWGDARYCETAERLRATGYDVVLLTSPGEQSQAIAIATAANGLPIFGESADVLELAAAISHCAAVITNDSGPLHLSAALAVPTVSIFGPTDPGRTVIPGASRVLRHSLDCQPCYSRQCPLGHHGCMQNVTVDDVYAAASDVLEEIGATPEQDVVPAAVLQLR